MGVILTWGVMTTVAAGLGYGIGHMVGHPIIGGVIGGGMVSAYIAFALSKVGM